MPGDHSSPNLNSFPSERMDQKRVSGSHTIPSDRVHSLWARSDHTRTDLSRTDVTPTLCTHTSRRESTSEHIHPQHPQHAQHANSVPDSSSIHDDNAAASSQPEFNKTSCTSPLQKSLTRLHHFPDDSAVGCRTANHSPVGAPLQHSFRNHRLNYSSAQAKPAELAGHSSDLYCSGTIPAGESFGFMPTDTLPGHDDHPGPDKELLHRFLDAKAGAPSSAGDISPRDGAHGTQSNFPIFLWHSQASTVPHMCGQLDSKLDSHV
jgi:hypothetical protein